MCIALDTRTKFNFVGGESLARLNVLLPLSGAFYESICYVGGLPRRWLMRASWALFAFWKCSVASASDIPVSLCWCLSGWYLRDSCLTLILISLSLCGIWLQTKYFESISEGICSVVSLAALTTRRWLRGRGIVVAASVPGCGFGFRDAYSRSL